MNAKRAVSLALFFFTGFPVATIAGVNSIVPDSSYRNTVCSELATQSASFPKANAEAVSELCEESMNGERWLTGMLALTAKLAEGCEYCLFDSVTSGDPVPIGYSTYILFLNPSRPNEPYGKRRYLDALYVSFKALGSAIGDEKLAIWFEDALGNSDFERARRYCDALDLSYNDGPYLVLTESRPDRWETEEEYFYLRLDGVTPERAIIIMNELEQDLRQGQIGEAQLLFEELKQRIISIVTSQGFDRIVEKLGKVKSIVGGG